MKRVSIIITLFCVLTAATGLFLFYVYQKERQVDFRESTEAGNISAAEGLEISVSKYFWHDTMKSFLSMEDPKRWNSVLSFGTSGLQAETGLEKWKDFHRTIQAEEEGKYKTSELCFALRHSPEFGLAMKENPIVYNVYNGTNAYFTFDLHQPGVKVDTSEIPGGYGIYWTYFTKSRRDDMPYFGLNEVDIYYQPLDPEISVRGLSIDGGIRYILLLLYKSGETYYIRLYNVRGGIPGEQLEEIPLSCGILSDRSVITIESEEDFFVVGIREDDSADAKAYGYVIAENETEKWKIAMEVPDYKGGTGSEKEDVALAFDGRKLARVSCGQKIRVSVYDATGLQYSGCIETSLGNFNEEGKDGYSIRQRELECRWKE